MESPPGDAGGEWPPPLPRQQPWPAGVASGGAAAVGMDSGQWPPMSMGWYCMRGSSRDWPAVVLTERADSARMEL